MHVETYVRPFIPDRTTWPMRYTSVRLFNAKKQHTCSRTGDAFLAFTRGHETRALLSPPFECFETVWACLSTCIILASGYSWFSSLQIAVYKKAYGYRWTSRRRRLIIITTGMYFMIGIDYTVVFVLICTKGRLFIVFVCISLTRGLKMIFSNRFFHHFTSFSCQL